MKTQIYGISIGMRLCTERTKVELPILTSATRTRSSLPLNTLLTRPSFQSACFFLLLTTKTTSPSCTVAPLRLLNCLSWVTYIIFGFPSSGEMFLKCLQVLKVDRNEVKNASFAQRSAHRDSRIWRPEWIEPAAERKRRARRRRRTFKSAHSDP